MSELEKVQELFDFLRGETPTGYTIGRKNQPRLTADQAWTVIWYLGNLFWAVPDHIDRCCVCGELYDSHSEGECLDFSTPPYHFCEQCRDGDEFVKKMRVRNENA